MNHLQTTIWHGQKAWVLESAAVRAVMVPELGAKIVSLVDKHDGLEWIVGPMSGRFLQPVAYGASFTDQDMSGWDEMFPTIVACSYPGAGDRHGTPLPDHGEVWSLPWSAAPTREGELALAVTGRALPYRLTRVARFIASDALQFRYTLQNLGDAPMPYLWAAHPQFVAGADCQILVPSQVTQVINSLPASWGWGPPETRFDWPEATAIDGRRVRIDQVGPASLHQARKFFAMPAARPSWVALHRHTAGHWLRMEWGPHQVPYLGLWVDEGAVNQEAVVAPEPSTGWYDDLALAFAKGQVTTVAAQETQNWTLTVRLGSGAAG